MSKKNPTTTFDWLRILLVTFIIVLLVLTLVFVVMASVFGIGPVADTSIEIGSWKISTSWVLLVFAVLLVWLLDRIWPDWLRTFKDSIQTLFRSLSK